MKFWHWCAKQSLIQWLPNMRHGKNSRNGRHYMIMFSCYRSASSAGGVLGETSDLSAAPICS